MKKIISIIIIGLLFGVTSLFASEYNTSGYIKEEISDFVESGGSKDGVKILEKQFDMMDLDKMLQSKMEIKTLKREIKRIATEEAFNESTFKAKTMQLQSMISDYMSKKFEMKATILSNLSQSDREAYLD